MKQVMALIVAFCLLLSGCSGFSDSYVSVTPHRNTSEMMDNPVVTAENYMELRTAFVDFVHSGVETGVIHVSNYNVILLEQGLKDAVNYVQNYDAIGAYAVESIVCEKGSIGVIPAVAVTIQYRQDRTELQKMETLRDSDALWEAMEMVLKRCDAGMVVLVEKYTDRDWIQKVEDYAAENPDLVMEVPQVICEVYPENGDDRVVSLRFTYQNSRMDLRQMQTQVQPIFNSAVLYASGGSDYQKLSRLYSFLMERFAEYQFKTSITPTYSLLHHGVGDSRAFAMVYAQMCRKAGIDSRIVTGTCSGEPWSWNMVESDGNFYHVDLLRSNEDTGFLLMTDEQMGEYVWDYSAYPASVETPQEEITPNESAETESEN